MSDTKTNTNWQAIEPERTYTAAELRLNQAALLREVAYIANNHVTNPPIFEDVNPISSSRKTAQLIIDDILAIPTDQPALDRHDAELLRRSQPDFSPGDVISAETDGTIVLDDGITTWNPARACEFLFGSRELELKAQTAAMLEKAAIHCETKIPETGRNKFLAQDIRAFIRADYAAALAEHDAQLRAKWLAEYPGVQRLESYVAERVRDAMREESEWWAARDVLKHPHKHNTKAERARCAECQRLDAHRAAAGAPEDTK